MATIAEVLAWKPGNLETVADALVKKRKSLVDLQDEIDDGAPPGGWSDDAATAAREKHGKLRLRLNDLVFEVSEVATEVDKAEVAISKARTDLEGYVTSAEAKGMTVNRKTGVVSVPEGDTEITQTEVDEVAENIGTALTGATQADSDLAAILRRATKGLLDGGTTTLEQAALPPYLRGMTDQEIIDYAFDHPKGAADYLPTLPEHLRTRIGDELGEMGKDIIDEGSEDYEKYAGLLDAFGEDEVVATATLNTLGPKGVLELNGRFAVDGGDAETKDHLQTALGELLAAGTRNTTGTDTPGDADNVSGDWVDELMAAGRERMEIPGGDSPQQQNPTYARGYQLLGPLLGEGDYGKEFLNRVGTDIYDFERDYAEDHDGHTPWTQVSPGWDHPTGTSRSYAIPPGPIRLDFTDGTDIESVPLGHDPMAGLMEGLADNPDAAREFFNPADHDPGNGLERVDYLLTDRNWPGASAIDMSEGDYTHEYPSAIASLGPALESATTVDPDARSVRIVESIVEETYRDFTTEGDQARFSDEDTIHPDLREDLANIMGKYMPSVHQAVSAHPDAADLTEGYFFDDARFNNSGDEDGSIPTRFTLAELAKDPEAASILRGMSNGWTLDQLNQGLHGVQAPDDVHDEVSPVTAINAEVLGAIDFGDATNTAHTNLAEDQDHNQRVDDAVGLGKAILGEIPTGKVPLTGWVLDQIATEIQNDLHQDQTGKTNVETAHLYESSESTVQALLRDTYWHNLPDDAYPPGLGRGADLDHLTAEQNRAYTRWLEDNKWGERLTTELEDLGTKHSSGKQQAEDRLEDYGW